MDLKPNAGKSPARICPRDVSWDKVSFDPRTQDVGKSVPFRDLRGPASAGTHRGKGARGDPAACAHLRRGSRRSVLRLRAPCVAAESPPRSPRVGSASSHAPLELPELRGPRG